MDPLIPLSIVYGLMSLGSASILYCTFSGKVDTSGKYFLLSEFLMVLVMLQVISTNLFQELVSPIVLILGNFFYIASEAAVFFSIYTLTRHVSTAKYIAILALAVLYSALIEICREWDPKLPVLLASLYSAFIAIATYFACKISPNRELNNNLFLKWIRCIEIGLLCFAILRIASYFSDTPINPRQPSNTVALIYTLFVTLSVFRYISYQSLRISWFDPRKSSENLLNKDMTKLVKEKNQFLNGLISSNRAIGVSALANSLAHQLSQPITGVVLQTESVKRDLAELGGQQKSINALNTVTSQLDRLSELINNLRRLFNFQTCEIKSVNLQNICDEILQIIEPTLASKNIQLFKDYKSNPSVLGNSLQIQQVLINLFNNAIDAITVSNSQIRTVFLSITSEDGRALISIEDTGNGLSIEMQDSMFELYKTTKKDGMGIGLWLCKEIIEKYAGHISAANSPRGGAIFEVQLPIV